METAIVVFTRDLRLHDNPVLAAASRGERYQGRVLLVEWVSVSMSSAL